MLFSFFRPIRDFRVQLFLFIFPWSSFPLTTSPSSSFLHYVCNYSLLLRSLYSYESNNKSLCDDFMCFLKSTDTFLFQWNNLFLVPKVKLDPIEQILIFVRMEQFVLTVQLDSTVQILIFVPMVQLDATNSKVCPIVTKFYICSNIIFLLSYVMQQKVSVPIIYIFISE